MFAKQTAKLCAHEGEDEGDGEGESGGEGE